MRSSLRLLSAGVFAAVLAVPGAARADALEQARALYREGMDLGNDGRWPDAAKRFDASLQLHRSTRTVYSLGVALKNSGRLVEARARFTDFLADTSAKTPKDTADVKAWIEEIDRRLAHVTVIVLGPGPIEHPAVTIDDKAVPDEEVALARAIDPGAHEIVASAGGRTARRTLTVQEGRTATVTLLLPSEHAQDRSPTPAEPAPPPTAPVATAPDPQPTASPPLPAPPPRRTASIALMGAGGAVFTTGLALGLAGVAQAHAATMSTGPDADAARTKAIAGDTLAVCGIAAAGIGLVLFLTAPRVALPASAGRSWITGIARGATLTF